MVPNEKEEKILGEKREIVLQERKKSVIDPNDVWLFTSKSAIDTYRRKGKLDELERDIKNSVMGGKRWRPEDLEFLEEIHRLVAEGVVEQEASRWAVSPFPPVYKALSSGDMTIGGRTHRFRDGEEIVFQCKMEQEMKRLPGPVLISSFEKAERDRYCGDMSGRMKGMG